MRTEALVERTRCVAQRSSRRVRCAKAALSRSLTSSLQSAVLMSFEANRLIRSNKNPSLQMRGFTTPLPSGKAGKMNFWRLKEGVSSSGSDTPVNGCLSGAGRPMPRRRHDFTH